MVENGTGWPVRLERRQQERIKLMRSAPKANFISQLIVERDQLPNGSMNAAVGAYTAAGKIAVRRMPAGYRKSVVA